MDELACLSLHSAKSVELRARLKGLYRQGRFHKVIERYTRNNGTETPESAPVFHNLTMDRRTVIESIHGVGSQRTYRVLDSNDRRHRRRRLHSDPFGRLDKFSSRKPRQRLISSEWPKNRST